MKKNERLALLLTLIILVTFVLAACNEMSTEEPEIPIDEPNNMPTEEPILPGRVNAGFVFTSYDGYIAFYQQFVSCNYQRYIAPRAEVGELFDTVKYVFEAGGVDIDITLNEIYASEFPPSQEITFEFLKIDDSEIFVTKGVYISGTLYDVSGQDLSGNLRLEAVDEEGNYTVCIGDALVCHFTLVALYYDENEYLNLMKGAFAWLYI